MEFKFKRSNIEAGVSFFQCANYYEIIKDSGEIYRICPSMTRLKYNYTSVRNLTEIIRIKPTIKVDYNVEFLRKKANGEIVYQTVRNPYNKKFQLNHSIIEAMKNIDGAIRDITMKLGFDIFCDDFVVKFDESKNYISIAEVNASVLRELEEGNFEDIDNLIKNVVTRKELKGFYKEMKNAIDSTPESDEKVFESILKKYQKMLPLIIPSIDLMKEFQYSIEAEGMDENIIDAVATGIDNIPNIIELKKSSTLLLNKHTKYRNNTYKPSAEFAGAIQQANMQRIHYVLLATKPEQVIVKSILLIGNKKEEFDTHPNKDIFYSNFDTIRYNNKDTEIITYDELLDRISNIITKFC